MEDYGYARRVFQKFSDQYSVCCGSLEGKNIIEIGPGGSLLTGILAKSMGCDRCVLIDVGDFASPDIQLYKEASKILPKEDQRIFNQELSKSDDVILALRAIGIQYYTSGLHSMKLLDGNTIDLSFSNAVLEHVQRGEFGRLCKELYRVHKDESVSAHRVDYKDHLGGGLNNLRFPSWLWESWLFPNNAFYTNRMRHSQVRDYFNDCGFDVIHEEVERWDEVPILPNKMAKEFRSYEEEDLLVSGALILFRKDS